MSRKAFLQASLGALGADASSGSQQASDAPEADLADGSPLCEANSPLYEAKSQGQLDVSEEVTLEIWVQLTRAGGGALFDKHYREGDRNAPRDGFALTVTPDGKVRFETAKAEDCIASVFFPAERPTYLAAVYSAARKIMKLYVDGSEVASTDRGDFPMITKSAAPMRVGADQFGSSPFPGRILQAAVYSRALAPDEIAQRSAKPETVLPGVLGDWSIPAQEGAPTIAPSAGVVVLTQAPAPVQLTGQVPAPTEPLSLWYRQPARQWVEALAIGNGRLGAMIFGGIERERFQLNEDTFWSGQPHDYANPAALAALPVARQLISDGKYKEADSLISHNLMGVPAGQCSYQPVSDLMLDFPGEAAARDYRRELNIATALASVSYIRGGVQFHREMLSSPVAQVIALRFTADQPGQIAFAASLHTPQAGDVTVEEGDTLVLRATGPTGRNGVEGKLRMECRVRIHPEGGRLTSDGRTLTLSGADSALVFVDAGTSFKNFVDISADPGAGPRAHLAQAAQLSWDALRAAHVTAHQRLFHRVSFDLGTTKAAKQPTDARLQAFAQGADDPHLAPLYYQFGRYLLISSSRPGSQPANLQGLWNQSVTPPGIANTRLTSIRR